MIAAVIRQILVGFFSLTDLRNLKQDDSGDNDHNKFANEENGKQPTAHSIELRGVNEPDETQSEILKTEKNPLVKKGT